MGAVTKGAERVTANRDSGPCPIAVILSHYSTNGWFRATRRTFSLYLEGVKAGEDGRSAEFFLYA